MPTALVILEEGKSFGNLGSIRPFLSLVRENEESFVASDEGLFNFDKWCVKFL
jgi:hypothetical protein